MTLIRFMCFFYGKYEEAKLLDIPVVLGFALKKKLNNDRLRVKGMPLRRVARELFLPLQN